MFFETVFPSMFGSRWLNENAQLHVTPPHAEVVPLFGTAKHGEIQLLPPNEVETADLISRRTFAWAVKMLLLR